MKQACIVKFILSLAFLVSCSAVYADSIFYDEEMKPITVPSVLNHSEERNGKGNGASNHQKTIKARHNDVTNQPNILLVQVDDLGFDDLAIHGNQQVDTPSLDDLAQQSVRFGQFYVSPLCAPSRASLLTGRHFLRTGVSGVHGGRDYINLNETLVSDVLEQNGYATGMWGKWHSGKSNGYFPWDRGFDEAYYATLYNYFDNRGLLNGQPVRTKGFATNAITDMAIDFIGRHQQQPFFAYVSYMAPHNPWRAPADKIEKYQQRGMSFAAASLYGMIDNLDENIGRLLQSLEDKQLAERTIVVFLSDNGPWVKSYRFGMNAEEWKLRNPNGRRGMKSKNWENGVKSPLFVRWPGQYQPKQVDGLASVEDLFPTLLEWSGTPIPKHLVLDGQSLKPQLEAKHGEETGDTDHQVIIASASPLVPQQSQHPQDKSGFYRPLTTEYRAQIEFEPQRLAIRQGFYKLVRNESGPGRHALFNLSDDPSEQNNLLSEDRNGYQPVAKKLSEQLKQWYGSILNDAQAMTMPSFQIGYRGRQYSQVNAYSPTALSSDLFNKDHFLASWTRQGQWAEYKINVDAADTYDVYLISKMKQPRAHTFAVSSALHQVKASLSDELQRPVETLIRNESAYWQDFDRFETFKSDIQNSYLGKLKLNLGEQVLRLSLEKLASKAVTDPMDQVIAIQLIRSSAQ